MLLFPTRLFLNAIPRSGGKIVVRVSSDRDDATCAIWMLELSMIPAEPNLNESLAFEPANDVTDLRHAFSINGMSPLENKDTPH